MRQIEEKRRKDNGDCMFDAKDWISDGYICKTVVLSAVVLINKKLEVLSVCLSSH